MSNKMNRRKMLKLLGATAALALTPKALQGQATSSTTSTTATAGLSTGRPDKRPNILYIFTDQQHAGMLSAAGNPHIKTPAMDSLAATGVRFEQAYCANPVCSPSRFSMFTGQYPSRIGMRHNGDVGKVKVPKEMLDHSLGQIFRKAGYETAYGGKVHLPMTLEEIGFTAITRDEREGLAGAAAEFLRRPHDKPFLLVASFINPHDICFQAINHYQSYQSGLESKKDHDYDWVDEKAVEKQYAELVKSTPQAAENLDFGVLRPQTTLAEAMRLPEGVSREEFFKKLAPPLPANHEPPALEPEAITTEVLDKDFKFRGYARRTFTEEQWRLHRWAYARLTERVDAEIGKVLAALREAGLEENTVVVFSSDHGDMDSAHRLEHKSILYQEATRIPFIISHKGVTPPGRVDTEHLVSNGLDLIPTLCDYAGITPPPELPGRSVRPLAGRPSAVSQRPETWRSELLVEDHFGRMLHKGRSKLAVYETGRHREFLIDLQRDPGEMTNLAEDPRYADLLQEHRDGLRRQTGDTIAAPMPSA